MEFSDLVGNRVAVWGYGREGQALVARLIELGIPHKICLPDETCGNQLGAFYGSAGQEALLKADVVIKSPGVPITSSLYVALTKQGVCLTSLSDLWLSSNYNRTVGVTGSKGKSTTAALIAHVLHSSGRNVSLRGNIGTSVLDEPSPPSELVVMEVSSYQAQSLTKSPRVVVVTSLFPEHQSWHGSLEGYYRDKLNILRHEPEVAIIPASHEDLLRRVREVAPDVRLITPSEDTVHVNSRGDIIWRDGARLPAECIPLIGRHQTANVALAALTCDQLGVPSELAADAIQRFTPLPHRLERVASTDGRTWIDDSLATAPEAVVATLDALPESQGIAVLIGGGDRGLILHL